MNRPLRMMKETNSEVATLAVAVEGLHGASAIFERFEHVRELHGGDVAWEGDVAVFSLSGHPTADRCYAWSEPVKGSDRRRFFAVLHDGPVTSPTMALRASIMRDASGDMAV